MEENTIKTRNIYLLANVTIILIIALFYFLEIIGTTASSIYVLILLLFTEAFVFLNTFKYLKDKTRKIVMIILSVFIFITVFITAAILIYENITGYVFIYRFTYGYLLISFIIYPSILLIMLLLLNKIKKERHRMISILTSIFVVCFMFFHGAITILESKTMARSGNSIYITDSMWLHGTEYEYVKINEYFMEYVGISNEW